MDKIVTVSKARQLFELLKEEIHGGQYAEGDKLPSIRELAEHYGLSKNTVNTVIAMLVNEGMAKVHEGSGTFVCFQPKKATMIGLMLFNFSQGLYTEADILAHIQNNMPNDHYLSLMDTSDSYDVFCDRLENLIALGVEGLLLQPPKVFPTDLDCLRVKKLVDPIPTVFINRGISGGNADVYSMDLENGIESAMEYLVTTGNRNIAILLHDSDKFVQEQLRAYAACCGQYGITCREDFLVPWMKDKDDMKDRLTRILPEVDGIIASDSILLHMHDVLLGCGREIPGELSLVGINDSVASRMFYPPLSALAFPSERIGRHAIKKLMGRISGMDTSPRKLVNYKPELIIRNT